MADHTDLMPEAYVPHALAIGALCNSWSMLESQTRMLLIKASAMPISRLSFGIVHCFDVRDCLTAIKLAIIDAKWSVEVSNEAISCINYIDSTLRVRRNRFVHDTWIYDEQGETMERFDHTPRMYKPQAFRPLDWMPRSIATETAEEIWVTTNEIAAHDAQLRAMQPVFNRDPGAGEALLAARPPRQLQPPQSEKPRPPQPEPEGQPPQRKS